MSRERRTARRGGGTENTVGTAKSSVRHQVYTLTELRELGMDDATIRRTVRNGDLTRLRTGWFAAPGADATVVAAVRTGGVLGCVSALHHHGFWVPPGLDDRTHIRFGKKAAAATTARSCRGYGRPAPTLAAVDPAAVALESALRCVDDESWIVLCDSVLNTCQLSVSELTDQMQNVPAKMRALLDKCDSRSQSGTETMVRLRLRALGFDVIVQPQIPHVGRVDLRVGRLLIECDSRAHHTDRDNYRNDRRRDRQALIDGWIPMRITYEEVLCRWERVLTDIRAVTRDRRHRLRGREGPRHMDPWSQ